MTVATETFWNVGTANGVTDTFGFTFPVSSTADVVVLLDGVVAAGNFTVTLTDIDNPEGGGNVVFDDTFEPANGVEVLRIRRLEYLQSLTLQNQGPFNAKVVERAFDRVVMLTQQISQRAPLISDVDLADGFDTEIAGPMAPGYAIVVNAGGDGFNFAATLSGATVSAAWAAVIEEPTTDEGVGALNSVLEVATLTTAKALTAGVVDAVVVRARASAGDGYGGLFVWRSGDQSAGVTADPQSGVWVAPDSASSGASGAWQRIYTGAVHADWFGAVGDGSTNDTTALDAACDFAGEGGAVRLSAGKTYAFDGLDLALATTIVGDGWGDNTAAASFIPTGAPRLLFRAAATPRAMLHWKGAVSTVPMIGGGISGVLIDGNNVATVGIRQSSVTNATVNAFIMRCVDDHLLIDDANVALSAHNYYPFVRVLIGSNAAVGGANGVRIAGNVATNGGVTSLHFGSVINEYLDGDAFTFEECDSVTVDYLKNVIRPAGTGRGVHFSAGTTFPAAKNVIKHLGRGGKVVADATTKANVIMFANSEGTSVDNGGNTGALQYTVGDFNHGDVFETHKYKMSDRLPVNVFAFHAAAGTPAIAAAAAFAAASVAFDPAGTETIGLTVAPPYAWANGTIRGVEIRLCMATSFAGDCVVQLDMVTRGNGAAFGSIEATKTVTITPSATGSVVTAHEILFDTALPFVRDDLIGLLFSRVGGDGSDSHTGDMKLLSMRLIHRSTGPNSAASTWEEPLPYLT